MKEKTRVHLVISGRVQGVYFRVETQRAAELYGVTGWVRNKPDGTVEAVAEGDRPDVVSLVNWCKNGPPISRVDRVDVNWRDFEGVFSAFTVRY